MSAIARAVLATAPDRFALRGLSMSGYIAFEMVRQAPDRIGELKSVRDALWPLFVHQERHDNVALKRAVFKMMDDTGPETFIRQQ